MGWTEACGRLEQTQAPFTVATHELILFKFLGLLHIKINPNEIRIWPYFQVLPHVLLHHPFQTSLIAIVKTASVTLENSSDVSS